MVLPLHWVTGLYSKKNKGTVVDSKSIPHTLYCCRKHSLVQGLK